MGGTLEEPPRHTRHVFDGGVYLFYLAHSNGDSWKVTEYETSNHGWLVRMNRNYYGTYGKALKRYAKLIYQVYNDIYA